MADVNISKYRASVVRSGSAPATPGFVVSEGQNPVEPAGSEQNHLPVTINATANALAITTDQVLSGAGTVGQYIRGDGSLADFPSSTGGGSSVSYYLNGSVSQGTIGGVAYKELSKTPILGSGTNFTINADGYIASFLTDAGDPNLLEIPGGNWNFETYFSASSGGGSPTFYVELYKYDGSTFTLIASNSGNPELIAFGTNVTSYFSTLAVPTTALTLTDRLAIRYYVNHSGRTITLHTENNHLCQVITTFTTGLTALNGLTAQVQYFAVGTSGTDFNIASATQTHTFNLPTASASNRGALSSADWSTFNAKQNALTLTTAGSSGASTLVGATLNVPTYTLSGLGGVPTSRQLTINGTTFDLSADRSWSVGTVTSVGLSSATSGVTIGNTPVIGSGTITLAIATATSTQQGLLSSTDWSTFNNKQNALTLTTTGTSGAATLVGATLNIPQYQAAGTYVTSVTASSPLASSGGTTPNITIQQASGSQSGFLSSTDWSTFNNKQNAITLTTTGTSGAATLVGSTLNIPQYQSVLTNPITGSGTTNYLPKFTGSTTIGNSIIQDAGTRIDVAGVLRLTPSSTTDIQAYTGSAYSNLFYDAASHNWQTSGGTAKMTLTASGNLLVGTTTDNGSRLQVNGFSRFDRGTLQFTLNPSYAGGNVYSQLQSTGALALATGGDNNRLYIDSSGAATFSSSVNVGGVSANTDFRIYRTVAPSVFFSVSAPGGTPNTSILGINGTDVISLNASGNVGIGTSSPVYTLDVRGRIYAGTSLLIGESGSGYSLIESTGGNGIWLRPNGVSSPSGMFLTTSGNVLIGTTTDVAGANLNVNGNIRTAAPTGGNAANWRLGTARGGTITPNAIVRIEIGGVLVDLDARYV